LHLFFKLITHTHKLPQGNLLSLSYRKNGKKISKKYDKGEDLILQDLSGKTLGSKADLCDVSLKKGK